jgi:uncharacterized protein (DUF58 family)
MKVSSVTAASPSPALWHGPGAPAQPRDFDWRSLVWALVFPPRRHRIAITVPGLFLIATAMGIGSAAYNTASNILFITLSLLLACLLLNGLLSWFNFHGVCWRLRPPGPWRAGHETPVTVEVWNRKKWLPTYGLWFDFATHTRPSPVAPDHAEALNVREALKAFEKSTTRSRLFLRERLEAGGDSALVWVHRPDRRGEAVIELAAVGSFFPFGFLRKSIGAGVKHTVPVWPAQVEYQWRGAAAHGGGASGQRTVRAGAGDDLLALRRYALGDSHRLIHWKASARLGQLMVRQFAAESLDGFVLQLDTPAALWTRPEQFELLCSFAGTLAEDLFAEGRLQGVRVNGGPPLDTRRVHAVETFLDQLARLWPVEEGGANPPNEPRPLGQPGASDWSKRLGGDASPYRNRNVITFAPEGARGVTAYVDGIPTASA